MEYAITGLNLNVKIPERWVAEKTGRWKKNKNQIGT